MRVRKCPLSFMLPSCVPIHSLVLTRVAQIESVTLLCYMNTHKNVTTFLIRENSVTWLHVTIAVDTAPLYKPENYLSVKSKLSLNARISRILNFMAYMTRSSLIFCIKLMNEALQPRQRAVYIFIPKTRPKSGMNQGTQQEASGNALNIRF